MHDPGLSCICIYIHPQVLTLIASVYLNVLLIARFAWCTVAVSSLLVNFLRGIFGTVFPFHFRNFSENSSFSVIHPYSYSRFSVQRTRTRKKLILNNRWNKRFERFHPILFLLQSEYSCFRGYGGFRVLIDLLKRGWLFVRMSIMFYLCLLCRLEKKELSIDSDESNSFLPTILRNEIECLLVSNY